eukprot:349840-Chlamydomonas_euryale.AAC.1
MVAASAGSGARLGRRASWRAEQNGTIMGPGPGPAQSQEWRLEWRGGAGGEQPPAPAAAGAGALAGVPVTHARNGRRSS